MARYLCDGPGLCRDRVLEACEAQRPGFLKERRALIHAAKVTLDAATVPDELALAALYRDLGGEG